MMEEPAIEMLFETMRSSELNDATWLTRTAGWTPLTLAADSNEMRKELFATGQDRGRMPDQQRHDAAVRNTEN